MSRPNPTIYSSKGSVCFLNVSKSHWFTVSNIGFKPGIVNIFDSTPNNSVSSHTKDQIAEILFSDKQELQLQFKPVQVQHGNADCEGFAVAFATDHAQENTYSAESPSQEVLTRKHDYRVSSSTKKEKSKW